MIVHIGNPDGVRGIDEETAGERELAGTRSRTTKGKKQRAVLIEDLDVLEGCIYDIDTPFRVGGNPLGSGEVARTVSRKTKGCDQRTVGAKPLDPKV